MSNLPYGAQSMTDPLQHVLVKQPDAAFGRAFEDPAHGFHEPVDLAAARAEHDAFCELLTGLGVTVHAVDAEAPGPDFIYQYDPSLVTDRGAILLRSGKPSRRGEEDLHAQWYQRRAIPIAGRIEPPGTVDGGDVFWLRPDVVCIGRSLRTNQPGIEQLTALLDGTVQVFDVPFDAGPDECLHLLSVISPVAEDLAVVELKRLPSGLHAVLEDLRIDLIPVPDAEIDSLACNVLTVRPGEVVMLEGNPETQGRLEEAGVEVHTFSGRQICWNGSGGPTCLTRPITRG